MMRGRRSRAVGVEGVDGGGRRRWENLGMVDEEQGPRELAREIDARGNQQMGAQHTTKGAGTWQDSRTAANTVAGGAMTAAGCQWQTLTEGSLARTHKASSEKSRQKMEMRRRERSQDGRGRARSAAKRSVRREEEREGCQPPARRRSLGWLAGWWMVDGGRRMVLDTVLETGRGRWS
jgi:hypothetical protein